jgi:tagatose 1,6-diphosphate aldolase
MLDHMLPVPRNLSYDLVTLAFVGVVPVDDSRGFVPYFHFRILGPNRTDIGHINFRVGDTEHVRAFAGHVGYEINRAFRGHRYAYQACRALAPFIRTIYEEVILTCDPDNTASKRTIERLGASFIDEVAVPETDPMSQGGARTKRRYRWVPEFP